jgi:hypothetical protein
VRPGSIEIPGCFWAKNQNRTFRSSMGDCHSFDPGSKFGLKKKKKKPNGHPGPGAFNFCSISSSSFENLQQNPANRDSPPSKTGMHNCRQSKLNSSSLRSDKDNAVVSPLIENGSLPVENRIMHGSNSDNNLLLLHATTTKGSKIDEDGFKQYLLAQRKRNWK